MYYLDKSLLGILYESYLRCFYLFAGLLFWWKLLEMFLFVFLGLMFWWKLLQMLCFCFYVYCFDESYLRCFCLCFRFIVLMKVTSDVFVCVFFVCFKWLTFLYKRKIKTVVITSISILLSLIFIFSLILINIKNLFLLWLSFFIMINLFYYH